jgi:uncharacterized YigZ family protein
MFKILKESIFEILEKKSRFITRIKNIESEEQAQIFIKEIIKLEKGAVHNCYAYRLLFPNNNLLERKSDDGEPGGTAGAPMLSILSGENLINLLAVTSRYFGGIKLGTGGLARVYKHGVQEALKISGKVEYKIMNKYNVIIPINEVTHLEYLCKKENIKIINKTFENNVTFLIEIPEDNKYFIDLIKNANGKIQQES